MNTTDTDTDTTATTDPTLTDESSYSLYYHADYFPEVCNKQSVRKFGALFLPPLYTLVFLFGLLGNAVVVLVLFKYKRLRSMTDVYLLNLAVSDLLFVLSLPFWAYYAADQWAFGLGLCKVISWVYLVGFYSGIFFITLMSVDRYLAIVHVVFSLRARTVTHGVIVSVATWSVAVSVALPVLLFNTCYMSGGHVYCKARYPSHSTWWKVLSILEINVLGLAVPSGVMLFCYSRILRTLRHCKNEKKSRAVRMIFAVVALFLGSWTPYNAVLFLGTLVELWALQGCALERRLDYALQATETLAFVHCCVNPVVYFFLGEKFRKHIAQLLRACRGPAAALCKPCGLLRGPAPDAPSSSFTQSTLDHELHAAAAATAAL